jgi:hypothetical protein
MLSRSQQRSELQCWTTMTTATMMSKDLTVVQSFG